jgi:hypothetical protein
VSLESKIDNKGFLGISDDFAGVDVSGNRCGRREKTRRKIMSTKATKIDKREDVNPESGEGKYGDVQFADPTNKKYPIDTPEHVRAAWSYINQKDNAAKYDAGEVETIKSRIKRAAKKHGVEIEAD